MDLAADGKYAQAIPILEQVVVGSPSEEAFYYLGTAYWRDKQLDKALASFQDGISKFPLSARLYNAAARIYEQRLDIAHALPAYRHAVALDPTIAYTSGGRYDPEMDMLYLPVVHDHRGVNSCVGRLYVGEDKMHYVVYIVASGYGPGNDDSFETPYSNISAVEVDRKTGERNIDYSVLTLLTNLSGPRRRLGGGEEARVDLKFSFKTPISGYRGNSWTKNDIKFFFIEPETGEAFLKFLGTKDLKINRRGGD
jgi:tetratricopeptide (TPR) repeat protein